MWVDVVTAVHAAYAPFLPATYSSLRAQEHPAWRWLVQIDGENDSAVRTALSLIGALDDPRVQVESNREQLGPAITRNIALGRAESPLLQNLDADDQLEPEALRLLESALRAHPTAGYAVGHARDLLPDGSLREHTLPLAPGLLARGTLSDAWLVASDKRLLPVHPAGMMWWRALVVELGGWTALHGMEDTGLLMAGAAVTDGVLVDAPTLRFRKHPRQWSARTKESDFAGGGPLFRWSGNEWPCSPPDPAGARPEASDAAHFLSRTGGLPCPSSRVE